MGALGPKTTKIWAQTMGRHKKKFWSEPGTHWNPLFCRPLAHTLDISNNLGNRNSKIKKIKKIY